MCFDENKFIENHLTSRPPIKCIFKVGNVVTFTNEYGLSFNGKVIIGFSKEPFYGKFIHLGGMGSPYWFPKSPESLTLEKTIA